MRWLALVGLLSMAEIPPLRVLLTGGLTQLPVFELELSGGTLTRSSPIRVKYEPPGATSGAPTSAEFVTYAANATLTAERVLTAGSSITVVTDASNLYITALTGGFVPTGRVLTTRYPLTGGGLDLSADRTYSADTAFLVTSARTITAGLGLTGGGNLGADRTIDLNTGATGQYLVTSAGATEGIAWITTAAAGGGPVYAPTGGTYLTYAPDADVTAERVLIAGTGVTVASDGTNFFTSVNTNIRDKVFSFFLAGTVSTTARANSSAVYIPFNLQVLSAQVAVGISASNAITLQLVQYNRTLTASTAMVAGANTLRVGSLLAIGSDGGTFDIATLYAGSHLGFRIVSTGAATFGQDLTLTVITRTS